MAKLLLLTDTHFGVRGNKEEFHQNMELFYNKIFFPYLREHGSSLDGIIIPGDVFDDRRKLDSYTASRARQYFFEPLTRILNRHNLECHIIAGNHDIYFRDVLNVNHLEEFIVRQVYELDSTNRPFVIHTDIAEIAKWDAIFVPWLTKNNRDDFLARILQSDKKYLFGHLELNGFNFSKVQVAVHGDDPKNFSKFKHVFSGHYHYKHTKDNITYLGSPTQHTWIDVDTTRGFHILDTSTNELEFISNPYNIFENLNITEEPEGDHPRFYRLYREGSEDQTIVNKKIDELFKNYNALGVDVRVKNLGDSTGSNKPITEAADNIETIEDTPTFIKNNVDDKEIANILIDLYNRAVNESE